MNKEEQMVDLLIERTTAGSVTWTPTAEENEFITSLANNTVSIKKVHDPRSEEPDMMFAICDEDGREVLSSLNGGGMQGVTYNVLTVLHELARRSALNIDKTLDKIIKSLENDTPKISDEDIPF
ncbi:MAG: hypothetical protein WBE86_04890 [Candidatus Acidiferrales bacterium]